MKKTILSVMALAALALTNANAQWTGTNPLTTTSNVGIGVAPTGLFDVSTKLAVKTDGKVLIGNTDINAHGYTDAAQALLVKNMSGLGTIIKVSNSQSLAGALYMGVVGCFNCLATGANVGDVGFTSSATNQKMVFSNYSTPGNASLGFQFSSMNPSVLGQSTTILKLNNSTKPANTTPAIAFLEVPDLTTSGTPLAMFGDDAYFTDIDIPNFLAVHGSTKPEELGFQLGVSGAYLFSKGGNLGIGKMDPSASLDVQGTLKTSAGKFNVDANGSITTDGWINMGTDFSMKRANGNKRALVVGFPNTPGGTDEPLVLNFGGDFSGGVKVDGKGLVAKEVCVNANLNWCDYVFDKSYKLRKLEDVEKFISDNKHLPEIPSAEEVEKDGIKTSEIITLQMKKIEELTLYIIEQNKRLNVLETASSK